MNTPEGTVADSREDPRNHHCAIVDPHHSLGPCVYVCWVRYQSPDPMSWRMGREVRSWGGPDMPIESVGGSAGELIVRAEELIAAKGWKTAPDAEWTEHDDDNQEPKGTQGTFTIPVIRQEEAL